MYRNYIIHVWIWKFLPGVVRRMLGRGRCEPRPFFKDNFLYEFNLKSLNFPGGGGGVTSPLPPFDPYMRKNIYEVRN